MERWINFKKLLATIGLASLAIPMSLNVVACGEKEIITDINQQIVDAINKINFAIEIEQNTKVDDLNLLVNFEFIKKRLNETLQAFFKKEMFSLIAILNQNNEKLIDEDLMNEKVINATVAYNYGRFTNQKTKLTLNFKVTEEQIVDAINNQEYLLMFTSRQKNVDAITEKITSDFIKELLPDEIAKAFNHDAFQFNKLTLDGNDLTDVQVRNFGKLNLKLNYDYGLITNQDTNLVLLIRVTDERMVDAINNANYSANFVVNTKMFEVNSFINSDFIKNGIPLNLSAAFVPESFKLNKIMIDHRDMTDNDLAKDGAFDTKINYDYETMLNQEAHLKITVDDERTDLSIAFKDFQFTDINGIEGFLDASNLDLITNQILKHINEDNLETSDLILEQQTSTSIIVKAKINSKKYQGEIPLTWNLKLFEIFGSEVRLLDTRVSEGLKGFIYLDRKSNEIRFFDALTYLAQVTTKIEPNYNQYHEFSFVNKKEQVKIFPFRGKQYADLIPDEFGGFDFTTSLTVTVSSPELVKVKVFNCNNNSWLGLLKNSKFNISNLGLITDSALV